MREIRRYDGNVNSKFLEDNCPSSQGSRGYPKVHVSWHYGRFDDQG